MINTLAYVNRQETGFADDFQPKPQSLARMLPYRGQQNSMQRAWPSSISGGKVDLPDIMSWSASVEAQTSFPYTDAMPHTVPQAPSEFEALMDQHPPRINPLDLTFLGVEFDQSCLDGLDDQLLHCPANAFAAVCWADAVHTPSRLTLQERKADLTLTVDQLDTSSDETDSDSDECRTFNDDHSPTSLLHHAKDISVVHPTGEVSAIKDKRLYYNTPADVSHSSFIFMDRFTIPDPKESVGFFPMPNSPHHRSKPNLIAAFCANFSGRLTKPAPAP
ncbi:hypothetical protein BD779DRAFT_1799087 [Infundibulicybe gibba]|nr:hypothetical protein BD779DRAFT_1799087 [Infundibulicybe gibba]